MVGAELGVEVESGAACCVSAGLLSLGSCDAAALVVADDDGDRREGLDVLGDGSNSAPDFVELWPIEYPKPKKVAHKITSPKNRASILPVPSVISVSSEYSVRGSRAGAAITGVIKSSRFPIYFGGAISFPKNFCIPEKKSTGTGKTTVVFFSTPISVSVCR